MKVNARIIAALEHLDVDVVPLVRSGDGKARDPALGERTGAVHGRKSAKGLFQEAGGPQLSDERLLHLADRLGPGQAEVSRLRGISLPLLDVDGVEILSRDHGLVSAAWAKENFGIFVVTTEIKGSERIDRLAEVQTPGRKTSPGAEGITTGDVCGGFHILIIGGDALNVKGLSARACPLRHDPVHGFLKVPETAAKGAKIG